MCENKQGNAAPFYNIFLKMYTPVSLMDRNSWRQIHVVQHLRKFRQQNNFFEIPHRQRMSMGTGMPRDKVLIFYSVRTDKEKNLTCLGAKESMERMLRKEIESSVQETGKSAKHIL